MNRKHGPWFRQIVPVWWWSYLFKTFKPCCALPVREFPHSFWHPLLFPLKFHFCRRGTTQLLLGLPYFLIPWKLNQNTHLVQNHLYDTLVYFSLEGYLSLCASCAWKRNLSPRYYASGWVPCTLTSSNDMLYLMNRSWYIYKGKSTMKWYKFFLK